MSKQAFDQVIQRASSDARFRDSLDDNLAGALRGYDLSEQEKGQLAKGLGLKPSYTRPVEAALATSIDAASIFPLRVTSPCDSTWIESSANTPPPTTAPSWSESSTVLARMCCASPGSGWIRKSFCASIAPRS